jgi:hypothetical protein
MKVIKIDLVIYQIITSILILKLMKEYTVYMQWDSYEGSLFNETYTSWYYVIKSDANSQARAQFGHNKGFIITG